MDAKIEAALEIYSADKLGIPDFALESAGKCFGLDIKPLASPREHTYRPQ